MMAQHLFPWVFLFSSVLALICGVQPVVTPDAGRTMRSVFAIFSAIGFVAMAAVAMWTVGENPGGASWGVEFFSVSQTVTARMGLDVSPVGVLACWLVAVLYGYVFFLEPVFGTFGLGVTIPSALLGISAIVLGWFSSSIWTALVAQALATLSGWLVLSTLAGSCSEVSRSYAAIAISYIRERGIGIALVVLGAGACAASGSAMDWAQTSSGRIPELGALLIVLGALLQMQLFPTLNWQMRTTGPCALPATIQLLVGNPSAWTSFALLYRMVSAGALQGDSALVLALALVLLTAVSALGKAHVQSAFGITASAIAGVSGAVLLGAGPRAGGTAFFISQVCLWALALFLRRSSKSSVSAGALRVVGGVLVLALFGGPGFATSGLFLRLLESSEGVVLQAMAVACWGILALATMRVMASSAGAVSESILETLAITEKASPGWRILPMAVASLLSLAVLWNGDVTGPMSAIEGSTLGPNWSFQIFGAGPGSIESSLQTAIWVWMLVLGVLVAAGVPEALAKAKMKLLAVPAEGYRLAKAMDSILSLGVVAAEWTKSSYREVVAPVVFDAPVRAFTRACANIARADRWVLDRLDRIVREIVEVPAKGLQLLQSGSVQFYLLFTVGFTLAMLLHFISQLRS
jgi:hypothetical protein